ncbi:MAG: Ig-like domain-containing protein, partial [Verrucomicrobiales bacterium]|nr:Ig-like domain-containing protein [Verrucomicrobiales bacterium]
LFQGAREIAIENDLAVVRAETGGLSFVDLRDPLLPTLVGKFPIQEPTLSLAVQWPYAVVGGTARTTVIDLRDPAAPVEVWSRNQRGYAVAAAFGRVYVAGDDALVAFDLESGLPVDSVRHPYRVSHARLLGDSLVTIADSGQRSLEVLPLTQGGDQLDVAGRLDIDTDCYACGLSLFVEPGFAYYTSIRGYEVADLRNPAAIQKLARQGPDNIGAGPIEKDSGNRLIVGTFASAFGLGEVALYDASNPLVSSNFLTSLTGASAVISDYLFYRGRLVCAVEDQSASPRGFLEVHGYRTRDTGTNPPSLALQAHTLHAAPRAEQSLGWFRLSPHAADDVAVRNVEFYLDGNRVADAGSHPFEVSLRAPELSATKTNFIVRARAFDTAGNSAWSENLTIALVPEIRAPHLLAFTPPSGVAGITGTVFSVSARFTETLAPASLASGLFVNEAGPDTQFGTADDQRIPSTAGLSADAAFEYRLQLNQPLPRGNYRVTASTNLTDLFGNRLLNPTNWTFLVREPLTWKATEGSWSDAANWNEGRIPTATDFVRIEAPGNPEVQLRAPPGSELLAYELRSTEPVWIAGGSLLSVTTQARFEAPVRVGEPGASLGVDLSGGTSLFRAALTAYGGLTLRDHALVLDAPGNPARFTESTLTLMPYVQALGSHLTLQPGSEAIVDQSAPGFSVWNLVDATCGIDNLGTLRKRGAGTFRITGSGTFRNQGLLVVEEGQAEVGAAVMENFGTIQIHPGATLRSGRIFPPTRHTRTGRVTGTGTNWITGGSVYEGEYDFAGTTICDGDSKEFRGGIRSPGTWIISGNGFTARGLVADFSGPMFLGGPAAGGLARVQFHASGETILRDIRSLHAQIVASGRLRVASPLVISNQLAFALAREPLTVRFEGPLQLAGRSAGSAFLRAADPALQLVFANRTDWTAGPAELTTNAVVAPNALFVVDGPELTELRGDARQAGLRIQGTYRKTGTGTNRIQRLVNTGGLVEITDGKVQSLLNLDAEGYVQSGGELRLAGGSLDVRFGNESSLTPGRIALSGGTLTGSGALTGDLTLTGGALRPGGNGGEGPGLLEVSGQVNFLPGSTLALSLSGTSPGTGHDQLKATSCEFDGNLEITVGGGFQPQPGQEFIVATFNQRAAREFRQVTGLQLGGGRRLEVVYEPKALKLRVVP